jgi:hypothetical protein
VVPFASVALREKEPAAVGVPVTAPVDVFSVSPAGSVFGGVAPGATTEKV